MYEKEKKPFSIDLVPEPDSLQSVIYSMVAIPHLSPVNFFNDFSAMVDDPSQLGKDDTSEAGIFEIDGENRLFSLTIYADHRRMIVEPEVAAQILVAKAVRRLVCYGAEPVAMSVMLNHVELSDPMDQQLVVEARNGLEKAAEAFGLQISHRKIFYDFARERVNIPPTLIVSMVGKMKKEAPLITPKFKKKGTNIFLIGKSYDDVNASEYLDHYHEIKEWPLMQFDLDLEKQLMDLVKGLAEKNLVESLSPVGIGGLFFTLLRASLPNDLGFDITTDAEIRQDAFLFGESMGRVIACVSEDKEDDLVDYLREHKLPFFTLGHVTRGEIRIDDTSYGFVDKMTENAETE
jgi:phosphoribosylformylglycinamidine synthase